jgi:putative redox protein
MIEAYALWTEHDRFVGQASSGHALVVDAGAEKSASSPIELVLIALCACTASDVVGILAMEDAVRLSKEKYCSVSAMLEKTAKIEFEIEYGG